MVARASRGPQRAPTGRSTLTISLVAAASFLIVGLSARLNPDDALEKPTSGAGGFALLAESDQAIFPDLNSTESRSELGFDAKLQDRLKGVQFLPSACKPAKTRAA